MTMVRIRLLHDVHGDWPIGHTTVATAGEYDAAVNQYGAVSVKASDGKILGIKPDEYEPADEESCRQIEKLIQDELGRQHGQSMAAYVNVDLTHL